MRLFGWCAAILGGVMGLEVAARVLGRESTRSRVAPDRALLVYDDDCGLCGALAGFFEREALCEVELVGFSELPRAGVLESLEREEVVASAHFVTADGVEYHGGESVTRAARLLPGGRVVAQLDRPVLRGLREIGYRLVSRERGWLSRLL